VSQVVAWAAGGAAEEDPTASWYVPGVPYDKAALMSRIRELDLRSVSSVFAALAPDGAAQRGCPRLRAITLRFGVASAVLIVGHLAAWIVHTSPDQTLTTEWATSALGTAVGQIELWRTGLAVLALWALALARRYGIALAFIVASLAVSGAIGHPAAMQPFIAIPAKAIHLLASGVWLGGLLWLVIRPTKDSTDLFRSDVERVSTLACLG
jgi:putative copper export protein